MFNTLEINEYFDIVAEALKWIDKEVVIHRLTGDGPKNLLIAPLWSANKKAVLNGMNKKLTVEKIMQGQYLG